MYNKRVYIKKLATGRIVSFKEEFKDFKLDAGFVRVTEEEYNKQHNEIYINAKKNLENESR